MMLVTYLLASWFGRTLSEPGRPVNYKDYSYGISVISLAAYIIGLGSYAIYKKLNDK
ncbi:hypothetical protein [Paenibacillus foliorum]|uniref:hypothetical protein n=1 Tax=Paenibacillus foliorum TaxID=2654974 RepID=UPI0014910139|nr:hypothetical protein [Paenibacillus foliorum]